MTARPLLTVEDLKRWEEHGATWRPIEVSETRAVVELCSCYGEPVDELEGDGVELIEFIRARREQ